jgi:hypothetical protein
MMRFSIKYHIDTAKMSLKNANNLKNKSTFENNKFNFVIKLHNTK